VTEGHFSLPEKQAYGDVRSVLYVVSSLSMSLVMHFCENGGSTFPNTMGRQLIQARIIYILVIAIHWAPSLRVYLHIKTRSSSSIDGQKSVVSKALVGRRTLAIRVHSQLERWSSHSWNHDAKER
jgi:hypothetical protein